MRPSDHVIAIHLAETRVRLQRTREGRARTRTMDAGDATGSLAGQAPRYRWRQDGRSLVLLLRASRHALWAPLPAKSARLTHDPDRFRDSVSVRPAAIRRDRGSSRPARFLTGLELEGMDSHLHVDTSTCELTVHLLRSYTTAVVAELARVRLSSSQASTDHRVHRRKPLQQADARRDGQSRRAQPGHFAHAFREATGVAPHRYVLELRVNRAKTLLRQSDLPITEVAERVGCSSHSHFSVLFHRVAGLTPRQFRSLDGSQSVNVTRRADLARSCRPDSARQRGMRGRSGRCG